MQHTAGQRRRAANPTAGARRAPANARGSVGHGPRQGRDIGAEAIANPGADVVEPQGESIMTGRSRITSVPDALAAHAQVRASVGVTPAPWPGLFAPAVGGGAARTGPALDPFGHDGVRLTVTSTVESLCRRCEASR